LGNSKLKKRKNNALSKHLVTNFLLIIFNDQEPEYKKLCDDQGEKKMITQTIKLQYGEVQGILIDLGAAPLILITAKQGYLMCSYLNMATANKLGDVAAKVTGVKTIEDALNATIVECSEKAKHIGLNEGIKGREFLNHIMEE